MKCYNHHDRDAFGVCKSCGKALCLECMSEESENIVCKDSKCVSRDKQYENMYQNATKIYSKKNLKRSKIIAIGYIILALAFAFACFLLNFDIVMGIFSLFFMVLGIIMLVRTSELKGQ